MVLLQDLNFKLSDSTPPDKIALAEGGTALNVLLFTLWRQTDRGFPVGSNQTQWSLPPCQSDESQIEQSLPRQGGIQLKVNNIYFELFDKSFDSFAVSFACNFTSALLFRNLI